MFWLFIKVVTGVNAGYKFFAEIHVIGRRLRNVESWKWCCRS